MAKNFFESQREQSRIKSSIVLAYLDAWAAVLLGTRHGVKIGRVCYVDLFAGPGRFDDLSPSTPLHVLNLAVANPRLAASLKTVFNDANADFAHRLTVEIDQLERIETLRYRPQVYSDEAGNAAAAIVASVADSPTLLFADPWGYKGLTLALIQTVLRGFGSECIFFFNYARVNAGLANDVVASHMNALFGRERAEDLRARTRGLSPEEREDAIVQELCDALSEVGGKHIQTFRFRNETDTRTKHHLVFVTKHEKGLRIMKHVMAKLSSSRNQGVATFEFNPRAAKQPTLFDADLPLDDLETALLRDFAGRRIRVAEIIATHHIDTDYVDRNYKDAFRRLEADGRIQVDPPLEQRKVQRGEVTFGDSVFITFPASPRDGI